jgi:hypothetical protein
MLDETQASFEVLYPLVTPGGAYVIEDWSSQHLYADMAARRRALSAESPPRGPNRLLDDLHRVLQMDDPKRWRPITRLVIELLLARASSGEAVAELHINQHWIVIRRGPGELDPESFRVTDLYTDHFDQVG